MSQATSGPWGKWPAWWPDWNDEIKDQYGRVIAVRGELGKSDLIAQGMLNGRSECDWTDADRLMVPCPFSLTCSDCDDGMGIESIDHARSLGWSDFLFDPQCASWSYIGTCPECRITQEKELTR